MTTATSKRDSKYPEQRHLIFAHHYDSCDFFPHGIFQPYGIGPEIAWLRKVATSSKAMLNKYFSLSFIYSLPFVHIRYFFLVGGDIGMHQDLSEKRRWNKNKKEKFSAFSPTKMPTSLAYFHLRNNIIPTAELAVSQYALAKHWLCPFTPLAKFLFSLLYLYHSFQYISYILFSRMRALSVYFWFQVSAQKQKNRIGSNQAISNESTMLANPIYVDNWKGNQTKCALHICTFRK